MNVIIYHKETLLCYDSCKSYLILKAELVVTKSWLVFSILIKINLTNVKWKQLHVESTNYNTTDRKHLGKVIGSGEVLSKTHPINVTEERVLVDGNVV